MKFKKIYSLFGIVRRILSLYLCNSIKTYSTKYITLHKTDNTTSTMISRNHYMVLLALRISARCQTHQPHFLASEAFHLQKYKIIIIFAVYAEIKSSTSYCNYLF